MKTAIAAIPEREWKTFRDGEIAETVHCMNKTGGHAPPLEQDLFEDAIASNRASEDTQAAMEWYCKRGDASENRIKDLKIDFGMEYMPAARSRPTPYSSPSVF